MFSDLLREKLAGIVELSNAQIDRLSEHYQLLSRWNKVLNLTAIRTFDEAVERHYCESIFLSIHLPEAPIALADVGSGAGFPGLPIAVVRPNASVVLIESHQRKAVFLREASRNLPNVRVAAQRAEDVAESFDWAVSRAVRHSDIAPVLKKLAPNAALLVGEEAQQWLAQEAQDQKVITVVQLPWGGRRYLWIRQSCTTF